MENPEVPIKKKRGRKPKNQTAAGADNITVDVQEVSATPPVAKKRGRKPKGGKLFLKEDDTQVSSATMNNIILHLKCGLHDLEEREQELHNVLKDPLLYNPQVPPTIQTYENTNTQYFEYGDESKNAETNYAYQTEYDNPNMTTCSTFCKKCKQYVSGDSVNPDTDDVDIKDVNTKLKELKIQLYKGAQSDKNSACFWCTYEFDNHPCYIPKYEIDNVMYGYGSFCQPECAVAYLMKQNLDDSTKFEQYHLLNQIYSKVYDYTKNIKPAPDPYYLLDKFYGNLTIQEYRKLIKSEHMLLVLDKPMTRTLPELHEDNEELGLNMIQNGTQSTNINTGMYKVKRNSEKQKGPSKNEIIRETFGI
jgi:hypothetical protein